MSERATEPQPAAEPTADPAAASTVETDGPAAGGDVPPEEAGRKHWMDWWHHSHPTFAALTGFYAGMAFVILVPSIFGGLLRLIFGAETAERYFPWVAVFLLVPIGLLIYRKTRRFAEFVWIGILVTAVVVALAAALTLWILIRRDA